MVYCFTLVYKLNFRIKESMLIFPPENDHPQLLLIRLQDETTYPLCKVA